MKFRVPHTLVLLFGMMILALVATYLLPQGQFQTVENEHGRQVVVADSYQPLAERQWLKPWHLLTAVPRAFADAQSIIFFVFIIGGVLAVIRSTGAIDAFLGKALEKFGSRPWILIVAGIMIFAMASSTLGMAEEYIPFVAILLSLCVALKLDSVTAVGIMVAGYGIGYGVAAINPFTLIIAQNVAELEPTSGIGYRLVLFLPMVFLGIHHVHRYAKKVLASPQNSLVADLQEQETSDAKEYPKMTKTHLAILLLLLATIAVIVYGISEVSGWHWYLTELGAAFLLLAILTAIVGRLSPDKTAKVFAIGAAELTTTALLIGFARSIALILEDGQVLHTIVNGMATPLKYVGTEAAAVGMFLVQSIFNFFIPSGSGQAYVTMPIMTPIADIIGVSRQVAVLAYQFGDGFTNMLVPTNAVLMGILGIAGIPYDRWFKFIFPLMLKLWVAGSIALVVAVLIGYS